LLYPGFDISNFLPAPSSFDDFHSNRGSVREGFASVMEVIRNTAAGLKGRTITSPHDYDQIPALVERSSTDWICLGHRVYIAFSPEEVPLFHGLLGGYRRLILIPLRFKALSWATRIGGRSKYPSMSRIRPLHYHMASK